MDEQTKLGMLFTTDLFLVAHTENPKLYGIFIDGLYHSEERAKDFIRMHEHWEDIFYIYRLRCDSTSHRVVFRGKAHCIAYKAEGS